MVRPGIAKAQHVAGGVVGRNELPVGLAELFERDPGEAVADEEDPEDPPASAAPRPGMASGHDKQHEAFGSAAS